MNAPTTTRAPQDESDGGGRRRWGLDIGIATVVSATITALSTYFVTTATNSHTPSPSPSPTVTITKIVTATPTGVPTPNGTSVPPPGPTVLIGPKVVQLTSGYDVSFSDPALRPYADGEGGGFAPCMASGANLYIDCSSVGSDGNLAVYPGRAGYSQCYHDTRYVTSELSGPLTDDTLCITLIDRIAACYVTSEKTTNSIDETTLDLTLKVTVYRIRH